MQQAYEKSGGKKSNMTFLWAEKRSSSGRRKWDHRLRGELKRKLNVDKAKRESRWRRSNKKKGRRVEKSAKEGKKKIRAGRGGGNRGVREKRGKGQDRVRDRGGQTGNSRGSKKKKVR